MFLQFLALLLSLSVLLSAVSSAPQRGNPIIPGAFGYGSGIKSWLKFIY